MEHKSQFWDLSSWSEGYIFKEISFMPHRKIVYLVGLDSEKQLPREVSFMGL